MKAINHDRTGRLNRRRLVQGALISMGTFGFVPSSGEELKRTPRDFTGPFYPVGERNRSNDLIKGTPQFDVLNLRGKVIDLVKTPIKNVIVDIWHADPNGRYKHPRDRGQNDLLDEFLYSGTATTNENGEFDFRTYIPGSYRARPANHIHYKVWKANEELLTSQIYFDKFGGDQGMSRSRSKAELQTIRLVEIEPANFESSLTVVI